MGSGQAHIPRHPDGTVSDLAAQLRALADRADALEPADLAGELERLRFTLWQTVMVPMPSAADRVDGDHLLGIEDAARHLAVTPDWLRRRGHLPFVVKLSDGVVRYSTAGIGRFIAACRRE